MLGSDYRELIVPKLDNELKRSALLIGGIALTAASVIFFMLIGKPVLLLVSAALGVLTWYLNFTNRIEYEYILSGDELTVTKILAESKRKPMLTVSLTKVTACCKFSEAEPVSANQTIVLACTAQDDTAFCLDFDHPQYGQTRMLWTPNDDILLYLVKMLPRNLRFRWEAAAQPDPEA